MHKLLIPLFACLICSAPLLQAQVPKNISVPQPVVPKYNPNEEIAICGFAGTFQLGTFIGQSNDTDLDTIYLCAGDSIFIDHNGDSDLSGDPNPLTPPGIGWGFYNCPPTIIGDDLQAILADPCILPGAINGIWVAGGTDPSGDIWFTNNGSLQSAFNAGQPILIHFAPLTLDVFAGQQYESAQPGFPPGPCVNVNTAEQFAVVYLNAIQESGVSTAFTGNDCLGKFRIRGGYPEFDGNATYTITITLASNPSIKAVIHTQQSQLHHSADVIFSAPQAGTYNVVVEDGKSCDYSFQITMGSCDPVDNVVISLPEVVTPANSQICIPVTTSQFDDVVGASFSVTWDPAILQFLGVQSIHPQLSDGLDDVSFNQNQVGNGHLGIVYYNVQNIGSNIPDGEQVFEICFNVLGQIGDCSPLDILNNPTAVLFENSIGQTLAVSVDTGQVCIDDLPLSFLTEVIDTACTGPTPSAVIRITPTGGLAPYEVIWHQISPVIGPFFNAVIQTAGAPFDTPQLPVGTWEITITDDNGVGQVLTDTVIIQLPQLGVQLDLSQIPLCFGQANGTAIANVTLDGVVVSPVGANYIFDWSPNAPIPGAQIQTNIGSGLYSVAVTQVSTGCQAFASGTMSQPSPISTESLAVTPAACSGIADGSITYDAQGGTPFSGGFYNFDWTVSAACGVQPEFFSGNGTGDPYFQGGLAAGSYNVTITDQNGCTFTDCVAITNQMEVDIDTIAIDNVQCNGLSNGAVSICVNTIPPQAGATYAFFWFGPSPAPVQLDSVTCSDYSNLIPGNYSVFAINGAGCSDTASFTIAEPPVLSLDTLSLVNPSCLGQAGGSITVSAAGGNGGPYSYIWVGLGVPGPSIDTLAPGTYCVAYQDGQALCADTMCFTLAFPNPPLITSIDSVSVKCGGDGSLTVNSPTGVGYNWTTLSGTPVGSTKQISGLDGDTYVVVVTDANGCTSSDTVVLASQQLLYFADTTYVLPTCFGYADGSITINILGGNQPIVGYSWTGGTGNEGAMFAPIGAGTYTVTATDAAQCTVVGSFTLLNPPPIVSSIAITDNTATCSNVCDGAASIHAFYGGGGEADFVFFWEDSNLPDSSRTDLCPGYTTVTIFDENLVCFRVDSIFIASPAPVTAATITSDSVSCNGATDGCATVTGTGGTPGYSYLWSTGGTSSNICNLAATAANAPYLVTITDSQGCTGTASIGVGEPEAINVSEDVTRTIENPCAGDALGKVAALVNGGTPAYGYEWEDALGQPAGNTDIISGLTGNQSYYVTVTDANGCTGATNIWLQDPPAVQGSHLPWDSLICHGDQTTLYIDTIFGGTGGPFYYSLDGGVQLDASFPQILTGGKHYITYFDYQLCEFVDTIDVYEPEEIRVVFNPDEVVVKLGDSLLLEPTIFGGLPADWEWVPVTDLSSPDTLMPYAKTYDSETYTLTVWDANGCSGTGSIFIRIDPDRNVYIPNIFIPGNPKGINDHFNVFTGKGVDVVNYMQVYDRWGELLYERSAFKPENVILNEGWDGRYRGKYVENGVYIYIIEVKFLDGRVLLYRGDVTVAR